MVRFPQLSRFLALCIALSLLAVFSLASAGSSPGRVAHAAPLANDLRISQVYGGGGNSGAPYTHDFIEIFNAGTTSVSLSGWSVQYASATGTGNFGATTSQITELPNVSLSPGQYFLIQGASGTTGSPLPTPDVTDATPINMSGTAGKVALASINVSLGCNGGSTPCTPAQLANIVDLVGYGSANFYEGSGAAPTLSNTTAALRDGDGCTDTDNNSADFAAGAPTPRNTASPTNTCGGGGDTAPYVSSTTPTGGATGVATTANLTVNFNENVNVSGSWFDITCEASGSHTAAVTGTPPTNSYTLNPDTDFLVGEMCDATIIASQVTDVDGTPDPMAADYTWRFQIAAANCTTIPGIQGAGYTSPCLGSVSTIPGCITGIAATGFYMQAPSGDGNPATADGIFVYRGSTWTNPSGWAPGQQVNVSGTIIEFYNTTEFQAGNTVNVTGSCTLPTPVTISPNTTPNSDPMSLYERYEGMRVAMSFNGWVVGPTKRFTSRFTAGDPEIAFVDFGSSIPSYSRVFEMDYPGYQGINYITGGLNQDLPDLDFGDGLSGSNITGVLGYQFDKYTLLVDSPPALVTVDNADVTSNEIATDPAVYEFDICYFNVENNFDNIDDGQGDWGDWAPGWPTSGSAAGLALYQAKQAGLASLIVNKLQSCRVIGLEEMEGKQQVYNDLAAAVGAADGSHTWTGVYVESGDSRDISQGFLYRDDVTLVGGVTPVSGATYTGRVSDSSLDFVRVPATALFRFNNATPYQVDIYAYAFHFKSKGNSASCSTPDCTDVRLKEAADMRDLMAYHQTNGQYAVGGGDLNDTIGSTPIAVLDSSTAVYGLFYDLPAGARYSYIFNGESEVLDHIYLTANLAVQSPPANLWGHRFSAVHVDADFPTSEHISDHDPLRVRLALPDFSDLPAYGVAWHSASDLWLGATRSGEGSDGSPDSDDGLVAYGQWVANNSAAIDVTVTGPAGTAYLAGWFDWDGSGSFDPGEKAIAQTVTVAPAGSTQTLNFTVGAAFDPATRPNLNARFRLYPAEPTSGPLGTEAPTGGASGGEVEDYTWTFSPTAVHLQAVQAGQPLPTWPLWLALGLLLLCGSWWLAARRRITAVP